MTPPGLCRLCGGESELQESHVLPAFIYRWARDTSANGHMRSGEMPNRRIQDGHKRYWLCRACEELFSASETAFASKLFYPYTKDAIESVTYGPWLLHFCASVSWRVLQFIKGETSLKATTLRRWKLSPRPTRHGRIFCLDGLPILAVLSSIFCLSGQSNILRLEQISGPQTSIGTSCG